MLMAFLTAVICMILSGFRADFLAVQLQLLTTHSSTKPPKANTAAHALPLSQSIQSLPLYTLP